LLLRCEALHQPQPVLMLALATFKSIFSQDGCCVAVAAPERAPVDQVPVVRTKVYPILVHTRPFARRLQPKPLLGRKLKSSGGVFSRATDSNATTEWVERVA
jgi:hypothetical protein